MNDIELLNQKPLVDSFLNQAPRPLSGFSFASIFAWCDFFEFELKMIDDCLGVFARSAAGSFLFLPPLGKSFDLATVKKAFKEMAQGGALKAVNRIENIPGNLLSIFPEGSYNQYLKPAEYVYDKEDLIALKGNAYKSQRHDCNCFFARHAEHTFGPYRTQDFDACLGLFDRWAQERAKNSSDDIYLSMLQENRRVHARLLKHWRPLGLVARVLKVDNIIIGYTFGFSVDADTFCVYAEIADLKATGIAAYMFKSFCADQELSNYNRINAMDDFAMPKVARAKQAYHPSALIDSYAVSLKF